MAFNPLFYQLLLITLVLICLLVHIALPNDLPLGPKRLFNPSLAGVGVPKNRSPLPVSSNNRSVKPASTGPTPNPKRSGRHHP